MIVNLLVNFDAYMLIYGNVGYMPHIDYFVSLLIW